MKSLTIAFVILGLLILITIVSIIVVMFLSTESEKTIGKICQEKSWIGDDICDDGNNNFDCEWDGGDCCGMNVIPYYCHECKCLEPNYELNVTQYECGEYSGFMQQRIVQGFTAVSPIPWQAFVTIENLYSCGGTILDRSTILSAAHCFPNLDSPSVVRVGSLFTHSGGQVS